MCKKIYLSVNGARREFGSESRAPMELGFLVLAKLNEMSADRSNYHDGAACTLQSFVFDDSADHRLLDLREISVRTHNDKLM